MTSKIVAILSAALVITGLLNAFAESPYIYPSQDTVDARKLQPGALVLLEPSAPMSMKVVDLGIYSGAIDEGNRTKQKLMISTGRIFTWDTQHYMPCQVLSNGPYGICGLKNGNGQEAYTSAAFLHRALMTNIRCFARSSFIHVSQASHTDVTPPLRRVSRYRHPPKTLPVYPPV
jgi:hypothetical protein